MRVWKYFSHIEYRIKRNTVTYTYFCFFLINNIPFYQTLFPEFVRWTPLNNVFGSKSRALRQQKSWSFFSSTTLAHFVWTFCANWHPINAKTYRIKCDYEYGIVTYLFLFFFNKQYVYLSIEPFFCPEL